MTPLSKLKLAALALVLVVPSLAAAQDDPRSQDDPYGAVLLQLGIAGEGEVNAVEGDLELSYGGGFRYMHPLHRYFVLGGALGVSSWQSEGGDTANLDRNLLFDLALVPAVRFPASDEIELYLAVPLGLTLDFLGEDATVMVPGADVSVEDPGFGFNVSFLLGARFALSDSLGLLVELGYAIHSFDHEVSVNAAGLVQASTDFEVDLGQLALHAGVFF